MAKANQPPAKTATRSDACIFCQIARGDVPAEMVANNVDMAAFKDTNPQAPVHILVIPKKHVVSLDDAMDTGLLGQLLAFAAAIARQEKVSKSGYRTVINTGKDGGQSVSHLHIHILGGRSLGWPPG